MKLIGQKQLPLGLPQGSVRALLAMQIVFSFWLMMLVPDPAGRELHIPLNLYFLLAFPMMFFVSYGRSMSEGTETESAPLGLPPALVKVLIIFGTAAVVGFQYYNDPELLKHRLTPDRETLKNGYRFAAALFVGFSIGYVIRALPGKDSAVFQFVHAWLALLAMLALVVEVFANAFIMPTLDEQIDITTLEMAITGIVATYYGTRS